MGGALHYLGDYFWGFNYEIIFNIPHHDAESQCAQKKTPKFSSRFSNRVYVLSFAFAALQEENHIAHPPRR